MGIIKYVTNNWRAKLVCLLGAAIIWYVIDYNVSPKRDVRSLRATKPATELNSAQAISPEISPEKLPNEGAGKK